MIAQICANVGARAVVLAPRRRGDTRNRRREAGQVPTIQAVLDIEAPISPLFDLAQDYRLRLTWDPFLRELKFRDGASAAAVGVRVWVRAHNGLTMEVEYLTLR